MPEVVPQPELMRSLGRLVRGLSALFWGLPASLIVCVHVAKAESPRWYYVIPPLACTGLLLYGLWLLGAFQKQERVWRNALDCARLLALINFGLSPFVFWWNRIPDNGFFTAVVIGLMISAVLFLGSLNWVLQRLGAMIPDEALRVETRQFTVLNLNLLAATLLIGLCYLCLRRIPNLPGSLQTLMLALDQGQGSFLLFVVLVLLPMAMTMALLWKTKEVILDNVFGPKPDPT